MSRIGPIDARHILNVLFIAVEVYTVGGVLPVLIEIRIVSSEQ